MPKYNSVESIPAKTFFEILKTKNYQLLKPKPSEKGLEAVFMAIYDDFFIGSDNYEAKEYLRLTKDISFYKYKIATLKQAVHFYYYNQTTKQMREDFIKALKDGYGIIFDIEADFAEEVKRVLTLEVGLIENDLAIAEIEFSKMIKKSQSKDFNYYEAVVGLGNILQGNSLVKEEMTLAVYMACEKSAKKMIEQQKNKK
jgi:hypothetical protein